MFVYGPVPSRRFGRSLGVSPIPYKTCNFNCIYCPLGKGEALPVDRKVYYPVADIIKETLTAAEKANPQYITITGDGEPTLYWYLGTLIRGIRQGSSIPVAVVTNGSLLSRKDVRQDLEAADVVLCYLDAGNDRTMQTINRPNQGIDFATLLNGIIDFRREFKGHFWIQVTLIDDINESSRELAEIAEAIEAIRPHKIFLLTPTRPPAEAWVRPPARAALPMALSFFKRGEVLDDRAEGKVEALAGDDVRESFLALARRFALTLEQARGLANSWHEADLPAKLVQEGLMREIDFAGRRFLVPIRAVPTTGKGAQSADAGNIITNV